MAKLLELYQAEWCPSSRRVRMRLTELGVDFVARQVPVDRPDRARLRDAAGAESIPTLVLESGAAIVGEPQIRAYLERRFEEPAGAAAHRRKAAQMHARELDTAA